MTGSNDGSGRDGRSLSPSGRAGAVGEPVSSKGAIDTFLNAAREIAPQAGGGRLVFALDATMSRQPTWDTACRIQADMFDTVGRSGNLTVQLVYFRGYGECRASRWVTNTDALRDLMTGIDCRGGQTQIGRVLSHARNETRKKPVSALVYIGDAMEENVDALCEKAGELGLSKVPCFIFQEGRDARAASAFKEIARLSGGAHIQFNDSAAGQLADLLRAVATYASGGLKALRARNSDGARLLLQQLPGGRGGG